MELAGPLQAFRVQYIAEAAAVFWIAAELAILFALLVGKRVLDQHPLPERIRLTPREKRHALVFGAAWGVVSLALTSRYLFVDSWIEAWPQSPTPEAIGAWKGLFGFQVGLHLIIWTIYTTIWVLLEPIILYHGLGLYRRLRARLETIR